MTPYYSNEAAGITLYCGDCLSLLGSLSDADAMVTDPPYGESHASNRPGRFSGQEIANDDSCVARDAVLDWWGSNPAAVFGKWSVPKWRKPRGVLVWDKGPASGMGDLSFPWKPSWEDIAIYGDGWRGHRDEGVLKGHTVVTWSGGSGQRVHPNEKPVSLVELILEKGREFRSIIDPFAGSGTTAIACIRTGRRFVGVELSEAYCEIAVKRIERELSQPRLFPPAPVVETQGELFT